MKLMEHIGLSSFDATKPTLNEALYKVGQPVCSPGATDTPWLITYVWKGVTTDSRIYWRYSLQKIFNNEVIYRSSIAESYLVPFKGKPKLTEIICSNQE